MVNRQPAKKAVLFLIDGMRPDGLRLADTPFMDGVLSRGSYTFNASSVMPTTTLPCHTSIFFSVAPSVHGVLANAWEGFTNPAPGLFEVIHQSGRAAASFYNWEPLRDLSRPGSLAASCFLRDVPDDDGQTDREISDAAAEWLAAHEWAFAFVYLHGTDKTGHRYGWMSENYLKAISNADRCVQHTARILPEDTLVIITSDHGGHDNTHHSDLREDMTVPFMVYGPGVPKAHPIAAHVGIVDIAPTIARFLDLAAPQSWEGRAIPL
jgi:predicted AlkP superfamily pyrophosphatase or phosphodiesterase